MMFRPLMILVAILAFSIIMPAIHEPATSRVAGAEVLRSPGKAPTGASEYLSPGHPAGERPAEDLSDVQDLLFMGDRGPVKIRLRLRVDGQPFSAAWDAYMQSLFAYADRDGNGFLDEQEAKLVPSSSFLGALMAGGLSLQTTQVVASFKELDSDGNGKVTLVEMKNYFRSVGHGPVQLHVTPAEGTSQALTDALFKALDQNHDGKLSKEEIERAEESLRPLDINEEELIVPDRLVPSPALYGMAPPAPASNPTRAKSRVSDFVLLEPGELLEKKATYLLSHYGKGADKVVTRPDIGLEKALFDKLDTNHDGKLEASELAHWFEKQQDLEIRIQLSTGADLGKDAKPADAALGLVPSHKGVLPNGFEVNTTLEGSLTLKLANAFVEMQHEGVPATKFAAVHRFHMQQFRGLRGDEKHVTFEQAKNNVFLAGLFPLADRDGNGQLTEEELEAFFKVHSKGTLCFTTVSLSDHGYGLFELLDTNHDNRLSPRELKAAWKVLEPWDANKDGLISQNELPRQFQVTFSQGPKMGNATFAVVGAPRNRFDTIASTSKKGPIWFRKMDRNGDGDVSRREFLGSDEDFRRIDADGDGLISVEEAEKADAWFRKRQK
jgi:Ca2+-binding EF-hand superfamily protein